MWLQAMPVLTSRQFHLFFTYSTNLLYKVVIRCLSVHPYDESQDWGSFFWEKVFISILFFSFPQNHSKHKPCQRFLGGRRAEKMAIFPNKKNLFGEGILNGDVDFLAPYQVFFMHKTLVIYIHMYCTQTKHLNKTFVFFVQPLMRSHW